jgi:hypothetical protein
MYIQDLYSGKTILWKFSMIYESGIMCVKAFLLSRDYGHWSQTHYYKYKMYVQNELTEFQTILLYLILV